MKYPFLFRESTDSQLLYLVGGTFAILTLVALMILPLGLPYFEHVVGYWWADEMFKDAVGQSNKMLWYKKAAASFAFIAWIFISAAIWKGILRTKHTWLVIGWAYCVLCFSVIGSQYLVMGGFKTLATLNLAKNDDDCPSLVKIVDGIPSAGEFLQDMPKYAGVDGKLRGSLAIKPPAYVLMFYYIDRVSKAGMGALGLDVSNLELRAVGMSIVFILLIGLFLIPMYLVLKESFSEGLARNAIMVLSMSPLIAHGFAHMFALGHHILIPVSSLSLLFFVRGRSQNMPLFIGAALLLVLAAGLVVWESVAFTGILVFTLAIALLGRGIGPKLNMNVIKKFALALLGTLVVAWAALYFVFGIELFQYFWDHFVVTHLFVHFKKMFVNKGPIVYFLSVFTNLICFSFFLGVPLVLVAFYACKRNLRLSWKRLELNDQLVRAILLFVLALDISGLSSETSRLWAFMAPAWYFVATRELSEVDNERNLQRIALALYILNGIEILIMRNVTYYV